MRIALTAVVLVALATSASAQFSQFTWTLSDADGGFGNVSATHMGLHGLFAAFPGSIVKYTTGTHVAGRVSLHAQVMPEDGVCSGGGSAAQYFVGASSSSYATCTFFGDVQFDVAEQQLFGFALQTFNTAWPYSVDLTDFSFTPYWEGLAGALAGGAGTPALVGHGIVQPGQTVKLLLTGAAPSAPTVLVVGFSVVNAPFKGGVLVPSPDVLIGGLLTNGSGNITLSSVWPNGAPIGFSFISQMWIADAGAPAGLAASNAMQGTRL